MDKMDQLVIAIQREIRRHSWDTFQVEVSPGGKKVTVPGCSHCLVQIGTADQFLDHLAEAIPALFARLRTKKKN